MAGLNSDGQLGINSTESQSTFVQVKMKMEQDI